VGWCMVVGWGGGGGGGQCVPIFESSRHTCNLQYHNQTTIIKLVLWYLQIFLTQSK